jgi:hypothetical protein
MSIGGLGDPINSTSDYLDSKYKRGDVLFLGAAGNYGEASVFYPAGGCQPPPLPTLSCCSDGERWSRAMPAAQRRARHAFETCPPRPI